MIGRMNLPILASPGFLAGLSVLLVNDFVLKPHLQNTLSGKLSDLAGLFVFPLFWVALFPRLRHSIYLFTIIGFAFWKSVYSQPLIETWNAFTSLPIGRTVDYTDLLALIVVPFSFRYSLRPVPAARRKLTLYAISVVSIFAFAATSYSSKTQFENQYSFAVSKRELLERMQKLTTQDVHDSFWTADEFEVRFESCTGSAMILVGEKDNQTVVTLKEIDYRCPRPPEKQELREYFEREFTDKLKATTVTKSPQVNYIGGIPKEQDAEQKRNAGANKSPPNSGQGSPTR